MGRNEKRKGRMQSEKARDAQRKRGQRNHENSITLRLRAAKSIAHRTPTNAVPDPFKRTHCEDLVIASPFDILNFDHPLQRPNF